MGGIFLALLGSRRRGKGADAHTSYSRPLTQAEALLPSPLPRMRKKAAGTAGGLFGSLRYERLQFTRAPPAYRATLK